MNIPLPSRRQRRQPRRNAVAAAAVATLLALPAMPALAQFYSFAGAVGGYPVDPFLTLNPANAVFNGSGSVFSIGNGGGVGSFSALAGAQLTADGLSYGDQLGIGSGSISGAGTLVQLVGGVNRLQVGNWGVGNLTVSGGAVIDATVNSAICAPPAGGCGNFIGNGAGSTALLTITGAGSEVRTARYFAVGAVGVNTVAVNGFDFGTPGGTTSATVRVLAGGSLRTGTVNLAQGPSGLAALGTEQSFATVLIDGPASQWIVTRNAVDNGTAFMNMATHVNATATTTVSGGGLLRIDGSGSIGPYDGLGVGNAGTATLTVTGANSKVEVLGANPYINVGASSATGVGTLNIEDGASATSLFLNVGRNGGSGTLLVTGAGSQLTLSGVGVPFVNANVTNFPASIIVGWNGGTGHSTVSNGGQVLITDGGGDGRASTGSPALIVGRDAGGVGTLSITGPGSKVQIVGTSLGLPAGEADNYNPFFALGYDGNGTSSGELTINGGGKLVMTGHALSSAADSRSTSFNVGGRSDTLLGGSGVATVSGPGSEIRVEGVDGFVAVGRNGTGSLTLSDQAKLSTMIVNVGRAPSGVGTLVVDNSQIVLTGQQTGSTLSGAGMSIGNRGGNGTVTVTNGSLISITNLDASGASVNLGGTSPNPLGTGALTLNGGSQIVITTAPGLATLSIGRDGSGTANLSGASLIDIGDGNAYVGRLSGGSGSLSITEASRLHGNIINIGGGSDTVAGGLGTATVSGLGSQIHADGINGFVGVGRNGANGTLTVSNQGKITAITMSVGRSAGGAGTLSVNNATLEFAGQQTTGNFAGASLHIGTGGGNGSATFANGSQVTMTNLGTSGATLGLGGNSVYPLGSGALTVSGGSQVRLVAAPGKALVRIGHDGSGVASFSGGSLLDAGDGDVIIAGEPGSVGTLVLNSGSVLNAAYVGVGSKPGGIDGGIGTLIVSNSTVNATTVEIGKFSLLAGQGGHINGHIINRGTLGPGLSPGRLIVDGGISVVDSGSIVLDVEANGAGGFNVDELVLVKGTTYDFGTVTVTFNFLGTTDPNAFAATGALDLDTFIRVQDGNTESGLSADFTGNTTWNGLFAQASFTAASPAYDVTSLDLKADASGGFGIVAVPLPVPEPASSLLYLAGLAAVGTWMRRRQAAGAG